MATIIIEEVDYGRIDRVIEEKELERAAWFHLRETGGEETREIREGIEKVSGAILALMRIKVALVADEDPTTAVTDGKIYRSSFIPDDSEERHEHNPRLWIDLDDGHFAGLEQAFREGDGPTSKLEVLEVLSGTRKELWEMYLAYVKSLEQ